jgi:hypothetical protein
MTCKQCIHYNACKFTYIEAFGSFNEEQFGQTGCAEFEDKSRFIELPCAVGDTVFWVTKSCDENGRENSAIHEGTIISFSLQNDGLWFYCRYKYGLTFWHKIGYFGKTVFLTKEEAEKALKEKQ